MSLSAPFLSVVTVCYNEPHSLFKLLESLNRSHFKNFEVLLVFNGEPHFYQQALLFIPKFPFPIQTHYLGSEFGLSFARNEGARRARSDFLFFTDPDIQLYPETLSIVFNTLKNTHYTALIGCYQLPDKNEGFFSKFKTTLNHFIHQNSPENVPTFWSACGGIQKDVFLKNKGFNTRYIRPSIEDIEFGYRLSEKGYKILLKKNLLVIHKKKWTFFQLFKTDLFYRAIPWTMLIYERNRSLSQELNLNIQSRFSVIFTMLFFFSLFFKYYFLGGLLFIFILLLNLKMIKHYSHAHSILFAFKCIPFIFLYYFISGIGYFLGCFIYYLNKKLYYKKNKIYELPYNTI